MKLIQRIFLKNLVSMRVNLFYQWRPCIFTDYLSRRTLLKLYWTKKFFLFWALSFGSQNGILAPKFLWIRLCFNSSSNPNNFYILTSIAVTDKCNLVRDLCKLFPQDFLSTRLSPPTLAEFMFMWGRYLIPNDWKQMNIWMRLLQNFLKSLFMS